MQLMELYTVAPLVPFIDSFLCYDTERSNLVQYKYSL